MQGAVQQVGGPKMERRGPPPAEPKTPPPLEAVAGTLPPTEMQRRIAREMPGFELRTISYEYNAREGPHGHIAGIDPRYGARAPTYGLGEVDTRTGAILEADYLPGRQDAWFATVTWFFTPHSGSFGGARVRWAYFSLGLAGAFLFYTGNLLWIESRRRKERKAGAVEQTRALGALTVGVPLGCVAGISVTIAAAKWLPAASPDLAAWHGRV